MTSLFFLCLASAENAFLQVSSFEFPNCWAETPCHNTDFSILFVGENNEIPNQLLPKFLMGHISLTKLVENE
jgi:hypothetical protein